MEIIKCPLGSLNSAVGFGCTLSIIDYFFFDIFIFNTSTNSEKAIAKYK